MWSQDDFYSFAAYFARLGFKGTGLSPPISGSEEIVLLKKSGSVEHPISKQTMQPRQVVVEYFHKRDTRSATVGEVATIQFQE